LSRVESGYDRHVPLVSTCLTSFKDEKSSRTLEVLKDLSQQLPKASVPRRLALTIASGDEFKDLARPYLTTGLTKGIPSLFVDIKSLYSDQSKLQAIQDIVEEIRKETPSEKSADPSLYVWTLYFLAQHYSFLSQHSHALEIVDLAISHTPTLPELYMFKARILKRAGDLLGASRYMEDARLLDGQDRFLNTKSAKYRLRAGFIEEASTLLGMFTKVYYLSCFIIAAEI
jgi:N-alpha-acetyltransferase 15/16, NatA auxiliary subunit